MNIIKEACVESIKEAKAAELQKADRVELCSRLDLDGLTPSRSIIKEAITLLFSRAPYIDNGILL